MSDRTSASRGARGSLLAASALALVMAPPVARADTDCQDQVPPPPIAPGPGFAGPPLTGDQRPVRVIVAGIRGCDGRRADLGRSGHSGREGQPAGAIAFGFDGRVTAPDDAAISLESRGGVGGNGSDNRGGVKTFGGAGGAGGAGGDVAAGIAGLVQAPAGSAVVAQSSGGFGGSGGAVSGSQVEGGRGGAGGAAGSVVLAFPDDPGALSVAAALSGVIALSVGGDGGRGGDLATGANGRAGDGGAGGGGAAVTIGGTGDPLGIAGAAVVTSTGPADPDNPYPGGVVAVSVGGDGGSGGVAGAGIKDDGGKGGAGGAAGDVTVTLSGSIAVGDDATPGLSAQSNGGKGGPGGSELAEIGTAGGGGFGGAGGAVNATFAGDITTRGAFADGVFVQSVGGVGGDGGRAFGAFFAEGGRGLSGGDAGAAEYAGSGGTVEARGEGAIAVLVQSIGGGGGSGGNALDLGIGATPAIGGNGGAGGDGNVADVASGQTLISRGEAGGGILVQSVGGAGGRGGSATAAGIGPFSLAIGGDGKGGGDAGPAQARNAGLVTTFGSHADGIHAQSVGGGGGKGGAAMALDLGGGLAVSVALGGRGGGGGAPGIATVTNGDQVTTYGSDAIGIMAQSLAGGGGAGGKAMAAAVALSPDPEIPAVAAAVALGGSGGAGGTAAEAAIDNTGFVATAGHGATALFAQSVGGGGGKGGDSSAAAFSFGSDTNISADVSLGGRGGGGGRGGEATITNEGFVLTLGESAHGMFAQSVGGGGGKGSGGDAASKAGEGEKLAFSASIALGGDGGSGGTGGAARIDNRGGVATRGDGAAGLFAQSVGGGGGAAGGGVGKANGDNLALTVAIGGNGHSGGDGGAVAVTHAAEVAIATRGAEAPGILAQSVGGGGGRGGKAASAAKGAKQDTDDTLDDKLSSGLGVGRPVTRLAPGVYRLGDGRLGDLRSAEDVNDVAGDEQEDDGESGEATSIALGVAVGGRGGASGDGGDVRVTSRGSITTTGAMSDGVLAQSVGGGGGMGGASSASTKPDDALGDDSGGLALSIGGSGGGGGDGGDVSVEVEGAGIATGGLAAHGVVAQSVGGGGGRGGTSGAKNGLLNGLSLSLGGDDGAGGDGGGAEVDLRAGATVATTGMHAMGVFAQSVGGGGGLAQVADTDATGVTRRVGFARGDGNGGGDNGGDNGGDDDGGDGFAIALGFGGEGGRGGEGGAAGGLIKGAVTTTGRNAHGVFAQSIGGGGGHAVGGQVKDGAFFSGDAGEGGDGGAAAVDVTGGRVRTTGDGAAGVWVQSIGGRGGSGGDFALGGETLQFGSASGLEGSGGSVGVTLSEGASVTTAGANAVAVFAQSVGGGGGHVATADGIYSGTAGGKGDGGPVTVEVGTDGSGAEVVTAGAGATAILAASEGRGTSAPTVTIGQNARVSATGSGAQAIVTRSTALDGAGAAVIDVAGRVDADGSAIRVEMTDSRPGTAAITVRGSGRVSGGEDRASPAIAVLGMPDGRHAPKTVLENYGTILAAAGSGGTAIAVAGDLDLTNTGTITGHIARGDAAAAGSVRQAVNTATGIMAMGGTYDIHRLENAGRISPDLFGGVGSTALLGDYVQQTSGVLHFDIFGNAAGSYDVFRIGGRAEFLGGRFVYAFAPGFAPKAGESYTLLVAEGGISGHRSVGARLVGLLPGFEYELRRSRDATALRLVALNDAAPIPLPPAAILLLAALGLLGCLRRRPASRS